MYLCHFYALDDTTFCTNELYYRDIVLKVKSLHRYDTKEEVNIKLKKYMLIENNKEYLYMNDDHVYESCL